MSGKLADKQMQYTEQNFILGIEGSEEGVENRILVWYRKTQPRIESACPLLYIFFHSHQSFFKVRKRMLKMLQLAEH